MLRQAYRMPDGLVLPLHCTGMAGMEAGIANLLEPGDTAIVARAGFFGGRIAEIARRHGATVVEVEAEWGEAVPNERILEMLDEHPEARLVAVVHAETSTGVEHPLAELGAALRERDTLLMADCVTSLGGVELDAGELGSRLRVLVHAEVPRGAPRHVAGCGIGGAPSNASGHAHAHLSRSRSTCCCSSATGSPGRPPITTPRRSCTSTRSTRRSGWRLTEGLEARWARHAEAGEHLQRGIAERGLELLADPAHQLAPLTAVRVPEGVDGKAVQTRLLRRARHRGRRRARTDGPGDVAHRPDGPERNRGDRRARARRARRGTRRAARAALSPAELPAALARDGARGPCLAAGVSQNAMKASVSPRTGPTAERTTCQRRCGSPPRGEIVASTPSSSSSSTAARDWSASPEPRPGGLLDRAVRSEREHGRRRCRGWRGTPRTASRVPEPGSRRSQGRPRSSSTATQRRFASGSPGR